MKRNCEVGDDMKKTIVIVGFLLVAMLLFALVSTKPRVWNTDCVGCGDCVTVCPAGAIRLENGKAVIDSLTCIDCKFCLTTCQYQAIR